MWFKDASVRGGPHTPADFNLFELPRHSLDDWVHHVSGDPRQVRCTVVRIRNVGSVSRKLFDALKADHGLASSDAVEVFDEYLGAACPQCFGGLTGSILQTVGAASSAAAFVGGGEQFQRILSGRCASCESEEYYVVWHGDKDSPQYVVPESAHQDPTKKWWQFWK